MTKQQVDEEYAYLGPWNGLELSDLRLEYLEKLFGVELIENGDNFSHIGVPTSLMIQLIRQARRTL